MSVDRSASRPDVLSVVDVVLDLARSHGYDGPAPAAGTPLADIGFDSLLTLELVTHLEDTFGFQVPDHALDPRHFATLASTQQLITELE